MLKQEFEELIGKRISEKDYKTIEYVYQFYPAISETSGKKEVAALYENFGIAIFYDMLPRAEVNYQLEKELQNARVQVKKISDQMESLRENTVVNVHNDRKIALAHVS